MNIHPNIARVPVELWHVKYSMLGWTLSTSSEVLEQVISPTAANVIIGMIRRASDVCAIPAGLARMDYLCEDYWDQQNLLEIERDYYANIPESEPIHPVPNTPEEIEAINAKILAGSREWLYYNALQNIIYPGNPHRSGWCRMRACDSPLLNEHDLTTLRHQFEMPEGYDTDNDCEQPI